MIEITGAIHMNSVFSDGSGEVEDFARYAGEACNFEDNIRKVLAEMEHAVNRKACFRCVICLIIGGTEHHFEGRVDGLILREKRGADGFGYDPVFLPKGQSETFAEMQPYLKNGISHRGRAMNRMMKFLMLDARC